MSQYLLKLSGSNDIYNIVEWDNVTSLTLPDGYFLEPFTSESVDSININDLSNSPYQYPTQSLIIESTNKTDIPIRNSVTKQNIVASRLETPYGNLKLQSKFNSFGGLMTEHFAFEDDNTLVMSTKNYNQSNQNVYSQTLQSLILLGQPNHLIKFISSDDVDSQIHFLITGSVNFSESYVKVSSSLGDIFTNTSLDYYKFSGNVVKDTTPLIIKSGSSFTSHVSQSNIFFSEIASSWVVDIETSYDTKVGTFYGDFVGTINGKSIETVLNGTKYGKLAFNSGTDLNVDPPLASFRFPTDPNDWNIPVSRITMDYWNSWFIERNDTYEQLRNYAIKVAQVIVNADNSCVMTLRSETNPNTFKKFRIIGGTYYVYNSGPKTCSQINWGQRTFTQSPSINCDRFDEERYATENEQMWFDTWNTTDRTTDFWTKLIEPGGYFDLDVEELDSNHEWKINGIPFDSQQQPNTAYYNETDESENDWFWVDFEHDAPLGYKRKQVFEFTSTVTPWQVPSWADELTIYAIGAGGGGGGGASGHGLHPIRSFSKKSSIYVETYKGVDVSDHKVLLSQNLNTLDDITTEFIDKSGHMYVTGGGGGAGGNVAVSKIKVSDGAISANDIGKNIIPRSSKLNIYVGSGGDGGVGSSYKDDINIELFGVKVRNGELSDRIAFSITPTIRKLSYWYLSRLGLSINVPDDQYRTREMSCIQKKWNSYQVHPSYTDISFYPEIYANGLVNFNKKMTSNNIKHFGKRGGHSFVELNMESNTITNTTVGMVKATGGFGGLAGWGITSYISDIHRVCQSAHHTFGEFFIPGGGSSIDSSFGNVEVRPGGHGGYGIAMPNMEKNPNPLRDPNYETRRSRANRDFPMNSIAQTEAKFRNYEFEFSRDYTFASKTKLHVAPSIPWNGKLNLDRLNTNLNGLDRILYELPWGSTVEPNYNDWEDNGHTVYNITSREKPNLPAPLGGSGGVGVNWFGVDDSNPYDTYSINKSFDFFNYIGDDEPNGATVDFGDTPSYIERVLFSKINGTTITSDDVEDYHPPQDVFQVQQDRIRKNILYGEVDQYDQVKLEYYKTLTTAFIEGSPTLFSTITRTTSNANGSYTFNFLNQGPFGGFGEYTTTSGNAIMSDGNDGYAVLPDIGNHYGQGGGGGAAAYVTDWYEKDTANVKGQDGGDGAGGIVIIVAEEL
jgi:hypothetical protein